jgi:hypothetical protein
MHGLKQVTMMMMQKRKRKRKKRKNLRKTLRSQL